MEALKIKKPAIGAMSYALVFFLIMVVAITSIYLLQMARLMTQQHHIDDALADAVLASLVADDEYYFETDEAGEAIIRLDSVDESYAIFVDCMKDAVADTEDFYYNFTFEEFITYEVSGSTVTITTYTGNSGTKKVTTGKLGEVCAPTGKVVEYTSAYGRVSFDLRSILSGMYVGKSKDIYCTIKEN